jgi:hypothetical protein
VIAQARADGVPEAWLEAARRSPVWKMAMEWKVAFPLHPEYRTLPMVWYVPPLSPIQSAAAAGKIGHDGEMPDVRSLRIPVKYLANLLTAGKEEPVALALERMLAMRAYMRAKTIDGVIDDPIAARRPDGAQIEEMYQIMAIANYEDRFVIPTAHRETSEDAYDLRGACGFTFGNGCSGGRTKSICSADKPLGRGSGGLRLGNAGENACGPDRLQHVRCALTRVRQAGRKTSRRTLPEERWIHAQLSSTRSCSGFYPYIALAVLVRRDGAALRSLTSTPGAADRAQLLRRKQLVWGSVLFHLWRAGDLRRPCRSAC